MKKSLLLLVALSVFLRVSATRPISAAEYIALWKDEAVYQMALHGIPASITLAQGMLESGNGNSRLATEGNNHFGIKCHNDWKGERIFEDDETRGECFRKYNDARESFEDHSLFLQKPRYKPLFELKPNDFKAWAKGLKECGYATNPKYPQLLIKLIEENGLAQFDEQGLAFRNKGELPPHRASSNPTASVTPSKKPSKQPHKNNTDTPAEITLHAGRKVLTSENRVQYILATSNDTPESIARDFDLNALFIRKFNDLNNDQPIGEGQVIYIKPKRNRGKEATYKVKQGDTMWSISQNQSIKLRKLRKYNNFTPGAEPSPGTVLKLRR